MEYKASRVNNSQDDVDENHVYVNIVLTNTKASDIQASVLAVRNSNIIDHANDWMMSIVRFSISSNEVPIFRPVIPNPAFPLVSNMSITLAFGGVFFQQFVNATVQEAKDGVFSFQNWLNHLNNASLLAFNALKAGTVGSGGTEFPRFFLDPKTSLISMYVQDNYLQTTPNHIRIFFNQQLQNILDLSFTASGIVPMAFGADFEIAVNDSEPLLPVAPRAGFPVALSTLAGNILQVSQEFPSLDEWSDSQRIFFTTGNLPVNQEIIPSNFTQDQQGTFSSSSQRIVTDFLINREGAEPTRHNFVYIPSVYRYSSLLGNVPIKDIDIQAWYQTFTGDIFPINLAPRTNMSMKIMFERKIKI